MGETMEQILEAQDRYWYETLPAEAYISWRMTVMWRRIAVQQGAVDEYSLPLVD
jgi:hypothetical protein